MHAGADLDFIADAAKGVLAKAGDCALTTLLDEVNMGGASAFWSLRRLSAPQWRATARLALTASLYLRDYACDH